jgi:aromatic ring-opening dioxygenase catalytic subunit (LigB family)
MNKGARLPVYFISHGGGPWSFINDPSRASYVKLEASLAAMPAEIGVTPDAVLMVSAHWEESEFSLTAHPQPPMVYDYFGFPDYTYQIRYDAPGEPALAARAKQLIESAGLPARLDTERGFDHGAFTPLKVIYPQADVPVVQLCSGWTRSGNTWRWGAIAPPRDENVPIIGSGLSYHNLRQFSPRGWGPPANLTAGWAAFCWGSPMDRDKLLAGWEAARAARAASARGTSAAAHGGCRRRRKRAGAADISRDRFSRRAHGQQLQLFDIHGSLNSPL